MENSLIINEVARLRQKDVMREVDFRQLVNQSKATKIGRPGLEKLFVIASETLRSQLNLRHKRDSFSPKDDRVINANA